jgi:histidine triad (HIT) family protein
MSDCLFCRIASGEIPSNRVYEDDKVYAFTDINPEAPVHILVIPKRHIVSVADIGEEEAEITAHIFKIIAKLSKNPEYSGGFRVVANCGPDAGQSVPHLHFHVLAGRHLAWPPG